eukprot:UN22602
MVECDVLEMDLFEWIEKNGRKLFGKKFDKIGGKLRERLEKEDISDIPTFCALKTYQIEKIFPTIGAQYKISVLVKELNKLYERIRSPVEIITRPKRIESSASPLAILIAMYSYSDSQHTMIKTGENDIQQMAESLEDLGFGIHTLRNKKP